MRRIVAASLKFRSIIIALAAALMIVGGAQLSNASVDVFPEFAPPFVEVQTEGFGMSTEEVESLITVPIEQSLNSIPGVDPLRSKSVPGLSSIKLNSPTERTGSGPSVCQRAGGGGGADAATGGGSALTLPPLSATSRAMKIGLTSDTWSLNDMSMITYWKIRWRLLRVPGVANVVIWGNRFKQVQVQTDPKLLRKYGMSWKSIDGQPLRPWIRPSAATRPPPTPGWAASSKHPASPCHRSCPGDRAPTGCRDRGEQP